MQFTSPLQTNIDYPDLVTGEQLSGLPADPRDRKPEVPPERHPEEIVPVDIPDENTPTTPPEIDPDYDPEVIPEKFPGDKPAEQPGKKEANLIFGMPGIYPGSFKRPTHEPEDP